MPEDGSVSVGDVKIHYTECGSGPTLVFVHGAYVTGSLWEDVIARLSSGFHCIAPTWPFGAQSTPAGAADLGVVAAGRRIVGLLEVLDLRDVTLIANDTGGGIVLAALGDPALDFGRVSRLVFTNCDSYEHFPPKSFAPIVKLCGSSARVGAVVMRALATGPGRSFFASAVTRHGIPTDRQPAIFGGFMTSSTVRREAVRFSASLNSRYTLAASGAITEWTKPALMAWGTCDKMFPVAHGMRLAEAFPNGELRTIDDSSTYVMLDQPDELARAVTDLVRRP
ncbi:alpha/beta hydrolase [Mycobacterium sp. SMC-2]|uniref:alpha/beta fold hydrolase n=1 Tax=Mycobacterium TaxID=1763 RepID=UPI001CE0CA47|nr:MULTISPECIES: alpha/beta hydrolase [Mycobacterium]MCA4759009.1 alpha/beta hydrolase [Mycobacterium avium subsp. hominissuis]UXA06396.1 alpha/beta hydrolase [Mycobacterium sp. SMC-2]